MTATMTHGLLVCQPRFGTPRNLDRPTLGPQVAEVARRLGKPFIPHQQHIADIAYELDDDGSLYYGEVDVVVGRQESKTETKIAAAVHRMTAMARLLGLPQVGTFTMQTRAKARKKLERDYCQRLRDSRSFREVSNAKARPAKPTEWMVRLNNGSEHIQFGRSSFLQIDAPSRTGGHGDTLDVGFIDEAFAHEDDTVEQSMTPAMITRPSTQLWVLSAAGDGKSKYLYRKILAGRAAHESGEHGRTCSFEWSAPDDLDPGDPATWALACPALGYTITEAKLRAEWEKALRNGQAGIDLFRRSFLCQWPEVPILTDDVATWQVIGKSLWEDRSLPSHKPDGRVQYALDVDTNARGELWASIGASDGTHLEDVTPPTATPGTGWVVSACVAKKDLIGELAVAGDGPAMALVDELEKAGITVRKVKPAEFVQASMQLLEALPDLWHIDQPTLNTAVAGVVRRNVGDGQWRFSRTLSPVDIGPLNAVSLARWLACQNAVSKYETQEMASL